MNPTETLARIQEVCKGLPLIKGAKVYLLQRGYNRDTFLLQKGVSKYIAHVKPIDRKLKNSLEKEASVLSFLKQQKITFTPSVIYFDKEKEVLISSYVASTFKKWLMNTVTLQESPKRFFIKK